MSQPQGRMVAWVMFDAFFARLTGHARHVWQAHLARDPVCRNRLDWRTPRCARGHPSAGRAEGSERSRLLACGALRLCDRTWAKGHERHRVTLVGFGDRSDFSVVGDKPLPLLGACSVWTSQTPFFTPRFIKPNSQDSLEEQVRAELGRRGLSGLAKPAALTLPDEDSPAGRQARSFRRFTRPVEGPSCLGWGSHFGLGLFEPVDRETTG